MRRAIPILLLLALVPAPPAAARDSSRFRPRTVDLLALIDPKQDSVDGEWTVEGRVLVCAQKRPWARIQIPYTPPDEYDLTIVAERKEGLEAINIGLVRAGSLFHAVVDGFAFKGLQSGLSTIDGRTADNNETTVRGQLLANDVASTVVCSVRKEGVTMTVDGKKIFDWKGDYKRLGNHPALRMPRADVLYLNAFNCIYRFSKISLTAVSGQGKKLR